MALLFRQELLPLPLQSVPVCFLILTMNALPQHLIDHYEDPYHRGACDRPTHAGERIEMPCECGTEPQAGWMAIQLQVVDETVREAWFDGDGCVLSQSAASLLMEYVEGKSLEDVEALTLDAIQQLLKLDEEKSASCCQLVLDATLSAAAGLLDEDGSGPTFLGLNLGEEC